MPDKRTILRNNWLRNFFPRDLFDRVRSEQLISPGLVLVLGLPAFTVGLWAFYAWGDGLALPVIFAKVSAFSALALLSLNHVLSVRIRFLEKLFRGLDRMYRAHHVAGQIALGMAIAHPVFLLLARMDVWSMVLDLAVPGRDFGITLGMVSLYSLLVLLIVTFALRITYHVWHIFHHLMVLPLLAGLFHAAISGTYMGGHVVLRMWVVVVCALGLSSYIYTMFLYHQLGPVHRGMVAGTRDMDSVFEASFKLDGPPLAHKAGQFVFVRFLSLEQSYEKFPFSISSGPGDELLRISAKKTGDFTRNILPGLRTGDRVLVWGPYGAFGEHYHHRQDDAIWIAGGIGVTPFLGMAKAEAVRSRRVLFVWACNDGKEALYDGEIRDTAKAQDGLKYVLWLSSSRGRITARDILELSRGHTGHDNVDIFLCGPTPMMAALSHQFLEEGFKANHIFFEDFSLL